MYRDGHSKMNKKSLMTVIALLLLLAAAVGTTVSYIRYSSQALINEFTSSVITCQIDETVTNGVKSSVTVKNTGDSSAYIRAAVIANCVNGNGDIVGAADVSSFLAGSGWVKSGMYYYYTQPVAPSASTGELLKQGSSIDLAGIQVTVLAEAIQSQPAGAAEDAWGVSPASLASN